MTTAGRTAEMQFHSCMPIFIALGDKVRLSIIEALTENAMALDSPGVSVDFADHAMNVNEITRRTSLSRPAHLPSFKNIESRRTGRCPRGRHCQLLLSHPPGAYQAADGTGFPD